MLENEPTNAEPQENPADWRSQYLSNEPELLNDTTLADVKDIPTLYKVARDGKRAISGMSKLPTDKSTPEEWEQFYTKIGRPSKPEEYKIDRSKDPKDMQYDEDLQREMFRVLHKAGATNRQVQITLDGWNQLQSKRKAQARQKVEANLNALHEEWGSSYDENIAKAQNVSDTFCTDEEKEYFRTSGYGNDPVLIKIFARISKEIGEDRGFIGTGAGTSKGGAQDKINEIMNDPNHPYHKGDKGAIEQMHELFKMAYPGDRRK